MTLNRRELLGGMLSVGAAAIMGLTMYNLSMSTISRRIEPNKPELYKLHASLGDNMKTIAETQCSLENVLDDAERNLAQMRAKYDGRLALRDDYQFTASDPIIGISRVPKDAEFELVLIELNDVCTILKIYADKGSALPVLDKYVQSREFRISPIAHGHHLVNVLEDLSEKELDSLSRQPYITDGWRLRRAFKAVSPNLVSNNSDIQTLRNIIDPTLTDMVMGHEHVWPTIEIKPELESRLTGHLLGVHDPSKDSIRIACMPLYKQVLVLGHESGHVVCPDDTKELDVAIARGKATVQNNKEMVATYAEARRLAASLIVRPHKSTERALNQFLYEIQIARHRFRWESISQKFDELQFGGNPNGIEETAAYIFSYMVAHHLAHRHPAKGLWVDALDYTFQDVPPIYVGANALAKGLIEKYGPIDAYKQISSADDNDRNRMQDWIRHASPSVIDVLMRRPRIPHFRSSEEIDTLIKKGFNLTTTDAEHEQHRVIKLLAQIEKYVKL